MQMGSGKMQSPAVFVLLALLCCVSCRQTYQKLIPNGDNPSLNCSHLGHNNCIPPTPDNRPNNNQFGMDFNAAGLTWTMEFCMKDSDNDGLTNGEELGDPCCEWTVANQKLNRTGNLSHPGDASNTATGDVKCSKAVASNTTSPTTNTTSPTANTTSPTANTTSSTANTTSSTANTTSPTTNTTSSTTNTISPEPAPESSDNSAVCFPGDAQVILADGSIVTMEKLSVGDRVEVAAGKFSPVFMFTHKITDIRTEFVSIRTRRGAQLHLSPGHFLYFNNKLAPAAKVLIGDFVEVDGESDLVVAMERVVKNGLYNPQTVHGDIVVNRFRVSTFTQSLHYSAAQAALTPFRAVYNWFGVYFHAFENGVQQSFVPHIEL